MELYNNVNRMSVDKQNGVHVIEQIHSPVVIDGLLKEYVNYEVQQLESEWPVKVIQIYNRTLDCEFRGVEFLQKRGILDLNAMEEFQLGFCNRKLYEHLPSKNLLIDNQIRGALQRKGLMLPSGHETFRGCVVFPYFDNNGNLVGAYGRRVTRKLATRSMYHVHWKLPGVDFFNSKALLDNDELVLCKSPIDALSFWCAGITNVIATMGIRNFGQNHLVALENSKVKRLYIAFDNNTLGNRTVKQIASTVSSIGIDTYKCYLPKEQDVNDYYLANKQDPDAMQLLLDKARCIAKKQKAIKGGRTNGKVH